MAYVDYKCLESLLIEGEDIIATEGLGSMIMGMISKIGGLFVKAINVIIGCFTKLFNKLKRSKGKKNTNNSPPISTDRSAERDANIKKYEDEIKQIHEDMDNLHKESEADIKKRREQLEERKKNLTAKIDEQRSILKENEAKAAQDNKDMHERLSQTRNAANVANNASSAKITKDVKRAINIIDRVTKSALYALATFSKQTLSSEDIGDLPGAADILIVTDNMMELTVTIGTYGLSGEKLSDANKDEICNDLARAVNSLKDTKSKYDSIQDKVKAHIDAQDPKSLDHRYMSKVNKNIQDSLIEAQKLATALLRICA